MKILITGASGLVGTAITNKLYNEGHEITAVYHKNRSFELPITWLSTNFADGEAVKKLLLNLGKFDVLIHSAAVVREGVTAKEYSDVVKINIEFTNNLFDWARENVSNCIVFISGMNFIRKPLPSLITEESDVNPDTLYGFSKYSGENYLRFPEFADIRNISLRLASPVADKLELMPDTVLKKWIKLALDTKIIPVWGKGARQQNFVATTDIAQAVSRVIENSAARGVYNIASATNISMKELATVIAEKTGATIVYSGTDALERESWNISIDKARTELGYTPEYNSITAIQKLVDNCITCGQKLLGCAIAVGLVQ